jgi:hypothetical protein
VLLKYWLDIPYEIGLGRPFSLRRPRWNKLSAQKGDNEPHRNKQFLPLHVFTVGAATGREI